MALKSMIKRSLKPMNWINLERIIKLNNQIIGCLGQLGTGLARELRFFF